jgi:hypothetical protein
VFYIGLSVMMSVIAIVGFWPTYFGPLVAGTLVQPPLIHLHATVFTGWLVLFFTQVLLAATRRVSWHLRLGRIGIAYGIILIAIGLWTGVVRSSALPRGQAEGLLLAATSDMVVFAGFFGAAIAFRRKPQIHKRLMIVAATMLLVAAVARFWFFPPLPEALLARIGFWFSPLLLAIAYDFRTDRRLHPVYAIGLVVFVARILLSAGPVASSAAWVDFTTWTRGFVR